VEIKVYADLPKEYLYEKGIESGLSEEAANYFKYMNEAALILTVDEKTGEVNGISVADSNFTTDDFEVEND
jgi:hypothetical protein